MNKTEKILSFSPYAYWQLHALYEVALCHNLHWRGHKYQYVSCDGLFSDCDMFWEATVGPRPANACAVCQSQVKSLLDHCQIPNTWLGKYKAPEVEAEARAFAQMLPDAELLDAVYHDYPLGAWVKSSVHSHLRINRVDLTNTKHCSTMRSYIYSGVVALRSIARLLDAEQPTLMLLFNGRLSITRIALELAKERGIRVVCHERGLAKETLLLWENETCLALRPYSKLWQEWGSVPLSKHEIPQVTQWLIDRAQGTNLNWKTFSVQSSLGVAETFLAAHEGRKIWSLFTSSTDEFVAEPEYSSAFGSQYRWIEETVAFVRGHPEIALVIRVHPNSGGENSTGRNLDELLFFQHLKVTLPANIALVMPDDKVSTYALIDRSELGLVYGSTVALEIAARGKPVLLAGRSPWMFCSGIQLLTEPATYSALLAANLAEVRSALEAERIARAAYRFAYAYVHRWNIPFPLVAMPDIHHGFLTAKTLEEFKPGVHPCLDYCAEIVLGIRSSVPPALAAVRKGAVDDETAALRVALKTLVGQPPAPARVRASVVITCYNYGKYLRDCIRSVVQQTATGLELIIVNDGSTDDSQAAGEACIKEFSGFKITLINQPNSGQPALARNAGIKHAKGEFILPLDADDQIDPRYIEEAFKVIDTHPNVDLVYSDSMFDNGKSLSRKTPGRFEAKALSVANQLVYCCLYRRVLWEKIGGYRNNVRGYEDWDFWLAASLTGARATYIPCIGLLYNEKNSGVYSETVAHHNARTAQVMLNNSAAYTAEQLKQAQNLVDRPALLNSSPSRTNALISVVIPCYNQAQYLPEAVASVLAQTYQNWEIVIVNDGSPDTTSQVAQTLILKNPNHKIRLIEKQNGGLSDARNAGVRVAAGNYILPLDADDKIDPQFLAKTVALLELQPEVAIAYTDWIYFGGSTTRRNAIDYDFQRLCTKENLFTCTSLYRKKAWESVGGYNINMTRGVEDWDFWIGCGERGFTGKRIPEPLFFYRAKEKSMIHTLQPHLQAMFARIVLNHPNVYTDAMAKTAQTIFRKAQLPAPKPSSPGVEWLPPTQSLAAASDPALQNAGAPSEEFFGADEVKSIEELVSAYSNNPSDPGPRGQLQALQQGMMNFLLTADQETLEARMKGSFGQVFRALVKSGLSSEPPTEEAQTQLEILHQAMVEKANTPGAFDVRPLLARMLLSPAHRGSLPNAVEKIPSWFLEDYLGYVLFAPAVFVMKGEAERYAEHMLSWVRDIHRRTRTAKNAPLTATVSNYFAIRANYIPLYFTELNTRELSEKRGSIIEFVLARNGAAIDATMPKRPKGRKKIKVGFLSAHFGTQTETHVTLPALQLDRSKFEVCLFCVTASGGALETRCRSLADSFTLLPQNLQERVNALRAAALDVLIIGTNVTAVTNQITLLAAHRLAPVQLVNYCSPVTTGMRHVDGYLSGTFMNVPGVQEHFTEKLQFCEGPPGCLDYTVEIKEASRKFDRASLGLGADEIVFINAAACFKILPEMQETWAKILKQVPKSRLLLLPFNPNWSSTFPVKQFERTLTETFERHGVGRDRLLLIGPLPSRADVKALEQLADVYLDTFPFSGSISVIDPLELGIPPVIWEGKTHRSRMASALLRDLNLPELIVSDEASYIKKSIALATDPALRDQLKTRILQQMSHGPRFIQPRDYGQRLGHLLENLVAGKKSDVSGSSTPPAVEGGSASESELSAQR